MNEKYKCLTYLRDCQELVIIMNVFKIILLGTCIPYKQSSIFLIIFICYMEKYLFNFLIILNHVSHRNQINND